MKKKPDEVYQFKITLSGSKPPIWRRILVPSNYSFSDLHVAIQDSMGWLDYHLHAFEMKNPATGFNVEIGIPNEEYEAFDRKVLHEHKIKISKYFNKDNNTARYEYDFGDSWIHKIRLEKIIPAVAGEKYPKCTAGKMACPPEDCGGIYGYYHMLSILSDPGNEEYEEISEWIDEGFDPVLFVPEDVFFSDPTAQQEPLSE
ncbi:MAG: plasmid pRiA4b ORF-3 family protein [Ignavibacteria bacterium]